MTDTGSVAKGGSARIVGRATLRGHLAIMRVDHWFKNVFIIPGAVAAWGHGSHASRAQYSGARRTRACVGLLGCIEQLRDQRSVGRAVRSESSSKIRASRAFGEGERPARLRPMAAAHGRRGWARVPDFRALCRYTVFVLWVMGCIYNIRPIRSKDLPYIDVLSEAVNNPLRMLAGWFIVGTASVAPGSLLLSYWMGRLLLHGDEALCPNIARSPIRCVLRRTASSFSRILHGRSTARFDHVLRVGGNAVFGGIRHALSFGAVPIVPADRAGDGDLLVAWPQAETAPSKTRRGSIENLL